MGPDKKQLRLFGLLFGCALGLLGLKLLMFSRQTIGVPLVIAGLTIAVTGILKPQNLVLPCQVWLTLGHLLGHINTKIILGVVYILVITPMAIITRLLDHDPLRRTFEPKSLSYRVLCQPRPPIHMNHPY